MFCNVLTDLTTQDPLQISREECMSTIKEKVPSIRDLGFQLKLSISKDILIDLQPKKLKLLLKS